jgi:Flp pilus assembly protein TadD
MSVSISMAARIRVVLLVVVLCGCRGGDGRVESADELVGSASCRDCHPAFHDLWATSSHGRTVRPFTRALAAGLSLPAAAVDAGGRRYEVDPGAGVLTQGGEGGAALDLAYAVGGRDVLYLLTPLERGRLQVLPVAWDVAQATWFDTTASAVRHFGAGPVDEALPWTDRALTFNTACRDCHVSHVSTHYDAPTDRYTTTWAEPGISCEACHGPGAEHVRVCVDAGDGPAPQELAIRRFGDLGPAQVNDACSACHAKAVPLTGGFQPGDRFFDHFDLVTLEHPDYHPDGRDLGENYTTTSWLLSPCVGGGELDCLHCHTASGRFRHAEQPDRSCEPCHADRVASSAQHSHHEAGTPGGRCIDCHMPATRFARMRRSDHSMRPPMPSLAAAVGSDDACTGCHADGDPAWAAEQVASWGGGRIAAETLAWASLVDEARRGDFSRLGEMGALIERPAHDEVVAASLLRSMRACDDPGKWVVIGRALADPSPLVRAAATAAAGDAPEPWTLPASLSLLHDDVRLVRVRTARGMAAVDEAALAAPHREAFARAASELDASLAVRPDDPRLVLEQGNLAADRGDAASALRRYQVAVALDPDGVEPRVNAAMVHERLGEPGEAERLLGEAQALAPDDPVVNLDLGLLLAGRGRTAEAEVALRKAFEVNPQLAVAAYNLCVLAGEARLDEAVTWCGEAARLEPGEPRYGYSLAYFRWRSGDRRGAESAARAVLSGNPDHAETLALLEVLR